jgi:hypothetical protein
MVIPDKLGDFGEFFCGRKYPPACFRMLPDGDPFLRRKRSLFVQDTFIDAKNWVMT